MGDGFSEEVLHKLMMLNILFLSIHFVCYAKRASGFDDNNDRITHDIKAAY